MGVSPLQSLSPIWRLQLKTPEKNKKNQLLKESEKYTTASRLGWGGN